MIHLHFHPQETDTKAKDIDSALTNTKSESQGKSLENLPPSQKLTSQKEESKVIKQEENINSCPQDFVRVGSTCYYISLAKVNMRKAISSNLASQQMGWIEARKKCEARGSRLLALTGREQTQQLVRHVR